MYDLTFLKKNNIGITSKNNLKTKTGLLFIVLCFIIRLITPYYIGHYLLLLLIPAIGLIIPKDSIKNSHIMPIISLLIIAFVIYTSIHGFLYPADTLSNLYFNGVLYTVPGINDINTCSMGNLLVIVFALLNIICAALYYIPTTTSKGEY